MEHKEVVTDPNIENVLQAFISAAECVPRGVCRPDEAHVTISKYYVAFIDNVGEVRLVRDGKFLYVEVRAGDTRLVTDSWDMFVLRDNNQLVNGPRLTVRNMVFTTDEFVKFVRRGFQAILLGANWV